MSICLCFHLLQVLTLTMAANTKDLIKGHEESLSSLSNSILTRIKAGEVFICFCHRPLPPVAFVR